MPVELYVCIYKDVKKNYICIYVHMNVYIDTFLYKKGHNATQISKNIMHYM
jgi:hypothetical protein